MTRKDQVFSLYFALQGGTDKSLRRNNFRTYVRRARSFVRYLPLLHYLKRPCRRSCRHSCRGMTIVHRGVVAMNMFNRSYWWRRHINKQTEEAPRSCHGCQST